MWRCSVPVPIARVDLVSRWAVTSVSCPAALSTRTEDLLTTSITFLQLSDLHLAPPGTLLAGVDPMRQMRSVLARIERLEVAPAFIVVSGDLTDNGSAESYDVVNEVLNVLPAQAWQSVQGDTWQGPESQYVEDVPSHFAEGPVGQDQGTV